MTRRPLTSIRTDPLCPYTTRFRSWNSTMGRSSCNLLVARALPAEPGRIAGPLYWTSTCHPFLFIRHIAAPTFLRLRISALFVQILAQFRWRIRGASLDLQTLTDDLHLRVARSEEQTSELKSLMR